jgi:hypothetical protein
MPGQLFGKKAARPGLSLLWMNPNTQNNTVSNLFDNSLSTKWVYQYSPVSTTPRYPFIIIDMEKALADGIEFYRSSNDVILTEGVDGVLESKYFKDIIFK